LGTNVEQRGRTNDPIFAEVQREKLNVVAIFGHEVFDLDSSERVLLWSANDEVAYRNVPPGSVAVPALITTSGHAAVRYAQHCSKLIHHYEPILGDLALAASLHPTGQQMSATPKFSWGSTI
jgi:hypothetical protein